MQFDPDNKMTDAEKEAQRQSWLRGELAIGNDAQEAAYRKLLRERDALLAAAKEALTRGSFTFNEYADNQRVEDMLRDAIALTEKP